MIPNEQLELFRDALLRSLKAARSIGLNLQSIELALMVAGLPPFHAVGAGGRNPILH